LCRSFLELHVVENGCSFSISSSLIPHSKLCNMNKRIRFFFIFVILLTRWIFHEGCSVQMEFKWNRKFSAISERFLNVSVYIRRLPNIWKE
jgi:hypothetical protein